jgi:hypothetical protein
LVIEQSARPRFTINLITPDNGEKFLIEIENATLTNLPGFLAKEPDLPHHQAF